MTEKSANKNQPADFNPIVDYWDKFYSKKSKRIPSQFAAFVASEIKEPHLILDFGCGNGRDSFFFSQCGHVSIGLDASKTAIETNQSDAKNEGHEHLTFQHFIAGQDQIESVLHSSKVRAFSTLPIIIYSRFFLHAILDDQEHQLFANIKKNGSRFSKIFFEYRESRDEKMDKTFGNHYRRFVNADKVTDSLQSGSAFRLDYQIIGQGFAKYGDEDPWIARQVFSGSR